ncbi:MAG: alanine/glycine:cation symporter family protein [Bacilli bacterium]
MIKFLSVLDTIADIGEWLNSYVWSVPLLVILLCAGAFFTIRTRFVQVRQIKLMAKLLLSKGDDDAGVSSFQAFALSVAGRVGTGNIAGVATAIGFGGPGALFWMWVIATLGSATAYIESTLGQIYKEEIDGEYRGGPAYYFEKFTGYKAFGIIFAVITLLSMGIFLPGVQANSIATAVQTGFFSNSTLTAQIGGGEVDMIKILVGAFVAIILAIVIFGGTKRLASAAEVIVPVMSIAYMIIAFIIIVVNIKMIPEMFTQIFKYAFTPYAGLGGILGFAIMNGVKRGLYSNEAGQGTGPHAAAAASVNHPAEQGLVQAFSVYFDTLLVCSATGFMILITESYQVFNAAGDPVFTGPGMQGIDAGPAFTQSAVSEVLGGSIGPKFVAIALFFFAFTTLMAYYYMAETNIAYLTGKVDENGEEKSSAFLTLVVRILFLGVVIVFSAMEVGAVWQFADVGVGIMAWYNVVGILLISILGGAPAIKSLVDYERQIKEKVEKPTFDPDALGIKNVDKKVWK